MSDFKLASSMMQEWEEKSEFIKKQSLASVFIVTKSGYCNDEYWDMCTDIEVVFSTKEKAKEYIKSIPNSHYVEEDDIWKVPYKDINEDDIGYKLYKITEVELK